MSARQAGGGQPHRGGGEGKVSRGARPAASPLPQGSCRSGAAALADPPPPLHGPSAPGLGPRPPRRAGAPRSAASPVPAAPAGALRGQRALGLPARLL